MRVLFAWAVAGAAIPIAFLGLWGLMQSLPTGVSSVVGPWLALLQYVLWPSVVLLLGMHQMSWVEAVPMVGVAVVANVAIYSIVGVLVRFVVRGTRG